MNILVVGAGAVGGYFGGRLAEAGRDVTFLVRDHQIGRLQNEGLRIASPHGDATLHPKVVRACEIRNSYDVVILAVKAYHLAEAMDDLAPAMADGSVVLPLLNGMQHLSLLIERFGKSRVIGGTCTVSATVDEQGQVVQFAEAQKISFGELSGGSSARMRALHASIQGAGFETELSEDVIQIMWERWIQMASLTAFTCLMRGSIHAIEAVEGGREVAIDVLRECNTIAADCGHPSRGKFFRWVHAMLTMTGAPIVSSMCRDMASGYLVEADHVLGDLVNRAQQTCTPCPLLRAAYVSMKAYEASLKAR